jgi:hypothetical protein
MTACPAKSRAVGILLDAVERNYSKQALSHAQ